MTLSDNLKDNNWTLYPFYSLFYCSHNEIFTQRSRTTQVFVNIVSISFFNALMNFEYIE